MSDEEAPANGRTVRPKRRGEQRWPMATAVLVVGVLHALLPADFRGLPPLLFQALLLLFLVALVIGDPGRIDRETPWLRWTTGVMIAVITLGNVVAAGHLLQGIFDNASFAGPEELLQIGGTVWLVNIIAFALWYWDLDAGGAAARAAGRNRRTRAFAFPETDLPEHTDDGWYPKFVDYLALSFNTASSFGPADVSAVKPWSKLLMALEAVVSLLIGVLVISRAINIWPS